MVMAPANTGKLNKRMKAVTKTAQTNRGIRCMVIPGARILIIVVMKFKAPKIEAAPAKCKLKIAKSTEPPGIPSNELKGGYTVHPVPGPASTKAEDTRSNKEGGINQKLTLFNRGKAISGAPIIIGTNQFPYPPIKPGITIKKIIMKACAVIKTLNNWWFPPKI